MRTARDYGPYERLMRLPATRRLVRRLNAASREAAVPYLVVGGSAVYLHTRENPEDYPDLDAVIDATKAGAKRFIRALLRRGGIRAEKLAETETDLFYKAFCGDVEADLFTEQEDRPNLGIPVLIRGVPVKRIEGLIAEKLSRFSYPDILMLFDLLRKAHDRGMVRGFALRINALGRLAVVQRMVAARAPVSTLRRWAAIMAGGERRGHLL